MFDNNWRDQLPVKVRIMQIIVGAMGFGCLGFLIIAVLASQNPNKVANQLNLTYIALLIAAVIFGVWAVLPLIIVSQGRKNIQQTLRSNIEKESKIPAENKSDKENNKALMLINLFQTKVFVGGAILESAVFFLLIAYMIEQSMFCLGTACVLLFLLTAQMPTCSRAATWVEDQSRLLDLS